MTMAHNFGYVRRDARVVRLIAVLRSTCVSAWLSRVLTILAVLASVHSAPNLRADVVTVCEDGSCDHTTIQAAVDAPSTGVGAVITILDEVHTESGIQLDKDVSIVGESASGTIIQAAPTWNQAGDRVLEVGVGATVILQDLTIRHGTVTGTPARGGGVLNHGTLRMERVTVTANRAHGTDGAGGDGEGGGIYSEGPLTIINSTVSGNRADAGTGG